MEDDKFFEVRETLVSLLRTFKDECDKLNLDLEGQVNVILDEMEE